MVEFLLRRAEIDDAAAIRKNVWSANLNPMGLNWRRFVLAVDSSGHKIGCVQLKPHRDNEVELASLVVVEGWQGIGVARALIEDAVEKHSGCLYLMCRAGLGQFYERFGFVVLDLQNMPPYFRRISQLMGGFLQLTRIGEGLLIMGRECGKSTVDLNPISGT